MRYSAIAICDGFGPSRRNRRVDGDGRDLTESSSCGGRLKVRREGIDRLRTTIAHRICPQEIRAVGFVGGRADTDQLGEGRPAQQSLIVVRQTIEAAVEIGSCG